MEDSQASLICAEAVQLYSQAIAGAPEHAALYGNRSAAYLALGLKHEAYEDALKATQLKPQWAKGCYRCVTGMRPCGLLAQARGSAQVDEVMYCRLGAACTALYEYGAAAEALARGVLLDGKNKDMAAKLKEARAHAKYAEDCRRAHAGVHQRDLVLKLRAVRPCVSHTRRSVPAAPSQVPPQAMAASNETGEEERAAGEHGAAVQAEHDRA